MAKPRSAEDRSVRRGMPLAQTQAAVVTATRAVPGKESAGDARQAAKRIAPARIRV